MKKWLNFGIPTAPPILKIRLYEVELTFDPSARQTWVIEPDLFTELRQIAQTRRVSLQTLVNVWLSQRVSETKIQLS